MSTNRGRSHSGDNCSLMFFPYCRGCRGVASVALSGLYIISVVKAVFGTLDESIFSVLCF